MPCERLLIEQIDYNLLFRRSIGLNLDDATWDLSTFWQKRDQFLQGDVSKKFLDCMLGQGREADLLADEHFRVESTLIQAWASMKSLRPKAESTPPASSQGGRKPTVHLNC